jgi:hypothetical protein
MGFAGRWRLGFAGRWRLGFAGRRGFRLLCWLRLGLVSRLRLGSVCLRGLRFVCCLGRGLGLVHTPHVLMGEVLARVRVRDLVTILLIVRAVPVDGRPEIAQSVAERPRHLRQSLRAEDDQGHDQDEQQMRGLEDVADHR